MEDLTNYHNEIKKISTLLNSAIILLEESSFKSLKNGMIYDLLINIKLKLSGLDASMLGKFQRYLDDEASNGKS